MSWGGYIPGDLLNDPKFMNALLEGMKDERDEDDLPSGGQERDSCGEEEQPSKEQVRD